MDSTFGGATPPASLRHDVRFEGSGGEYFKIWIVNLALTIATLGIFSAWAKVRNKRYFYGNTFIAGHSFDYHGQPVRILIGRLIALGLLLAYTISTTFAPMTALFWVPLFLLAAPWLIVASFRFNARNTSYRNLRFDFHGTYWGAVKAFILWPILAGITLFTTWPLAHRARYHYQIGCHSFGGKQFETAIPAGRMYLIYLAALGIIVGAFVLLFCVFLVLGLSLVAMNTSMADGSGTTLLSMMITFTTLVLFFFLYSFVGTMTFNLAIGSTKLGEDFALESALSPLRIAWIAFSNLVLVVVTLGLFTPWAHVRLTRYLADRMAVTGPRSVDGFIDSAPRQSSAVGEEVAGFFDFDFSL